jgi:large subunit ribosomal protein L10
LAGSVLEPLAKSLAGPCALVYGEPAITDIAKELAKWAKSHKTITLKHGIMEGDPDLLAVEELSRMKGQTELVGEIGMLVSSPGSNLAAQLGSPAGKIAGCLKAMIEEKEAA